MPELTPEDKIKLAVSFIEQSPPGEVNFVVESSTDPSDVVNDIRAIVGDDDALMPHAVPALRAYNLAQLQVVEHTAVDDVPAHSSLISEALIVPASDPERFYDHAFNRTFIFDHVTLLASDYAPVELPPADAEFRSALADSLGKYARNHFPSGQASVSTNQVPLPPPSPPSPVSDLGAGVAPSSPPLPQEPTERAQPGIAEEDPTPMVGSVPRTADDEVDAEGGLEKLDEEVMEEAKAEEAEAALEAKGAEGGDEEFPDERHPAGIAEEDPTPLTGPTPPHAEDEVDAEGGLEKLDEEVTDAKAEIDDGEGDQAHVEGDARAPAAENEDTGEAGAAAASSATSAAPEPHPPLDNPTFTLEIVGNRFNPSNFWTGRWRTRWIVDRGAGRVEGNIKVDIHYYEQGNVQLTTDHRASFEIPADADTDIVALASLIVTNIGRIETEYQHEIGDVYKTLGDKTFRALRRALPVTRQRVDWDKVSGYSIGSDISKAFT